MGKVLVSSFPVYSLEAQGQSSKNGVCQPSQGVSTYQMPQLLSKNTVQLLGSLPRNSFLLNFWSRLPDFLYTQDVYAKKTRAAVHYMWENLTAWPQLIEKKRLSSKGLAKVVREEDAVVGQGQSWGQIHNVPPVRKFT